MRPSCRFSLVAAALLSILAAPSVLAQAARTMPSLDGVTRAAIVDSVTAVIDSVYVFAEPAREIVAALRANLASGTYDAITDPAAFAQRLDDDAQAIHHDGHFGIIARPTGEGGPPGSAQEDSVQAARRRRMFQQRNYFFRKAEILPGGIGYLRFDGFADGDDAFAAATAAMNFLANCDAVILDLRHNGGGNASMIRYLCGYALPKAKHLINWDVRAQGKTTQSYSADFVPGKRLLDQLVYILTSRTTFSAAEEFTFDLHNLGRATLVGETTGGGGNTVSGYTFAFDGFLIGIRVPYGHAYDPRTGEGWEGVGIEPDIAVPADEALAAAQADALTKLSEKTTDPAARAGLQWALGDVQSQQHPVTLSAKQMKEFVGGYGPRKVFLKDGELWYQREGRDPLALVPMGDDLFRVGDLDFFRLGFERDAKGGIVKVVGHYNDGHVDENPRDGG